MHGVLDSPSIVSIMALNPKPSRSLRTVRICTPYALHLKTSTSITCWDTRQC